jgi:uncharacterized protein (TIGR01244 family)
MADIRWVTERFAVAPQLSVEDAGRLGDLGFRHVINNRPDGEAFGQPRGSAIQEAVEAAGLSYRHAPFQGAPTPDAVATVGDALKVNSGPVLAFCRSGTRSITAWAISEAQQGGDATIILQQAATAGYDLTPLKELLQSTGNR